MVTTEFGRFACRLRLEAGSLPGSRAWIEASKAPGRKRRYPEEITHFCSQLFEKGTRRALCVTVPNVG